MNIRFTLWTVAALAASAFLTGTAVAGGRMSRELVRPSTSPDAAARGEVRVHRSPRRTRLLIRLKGLEAGKTYQIHDRDSGVVLGTVTANRHGRARFDLTRGIDKAKESGADDGICEHVEVVDEETGDDVLRGDLTPDSYWASDIFNDAERDWVDVWLFSDRDPREGDIFAIEVHLPSGPDDPNVEHDNLLTHRAGFDGVRGTIRMSGGPPNLPLGTRRVKELAGRAYEIRKPDGTVLAARRLPQLQAGSIIPHSKSDPTEAEYAAMIDPRDDPNWHAPAEQEPDAATPGLRVFIADTQGTLQFAFNLVPAWVTWDAENLGLSTCHEAGCSVDPPAWYLRLAGRTGK